MGKNHQGELALLRTRPFQVLLLLNPAPRLLLALAVWIQAALMERWAVLSMRVL